VRWSRRPRYPSVDRGPLRRRAPGRFGPLCEGSLGPAQASVLRPADCGSSRPRGWQWRRTGRTFRWQLRRIPGTRGEVGRRSDF
jgi:hypothetical protein